MLRAIPAAKLYDHWGWVRNGLLAAIEKTGERWLPEDAYLAIKAGTSHLFAIEHRSDDVGFVILQRHDDPDGGALFVWALWLEPGAGRPIEGAIYNALVAKAREIGAKRVRMQSPRKGWARRDYWRQMAVVYEHEVGP